MELRQITEKIFVSPQVAPEDVATLKADGFTTLICNRPDTENPELLQAAALQQPSNRIGICL